VPATPQRSSKSPRALESESAGEPTPIKFVLAVLVFVVPFGRSQALALRAQGWEHIAP